MTLKSPKPPRKPQVETLVIPVGKFYYEVPFRKPQAKRQPPRRPTKGDVKRGNAWSASLVKP